MPEILHLLSDRIDTPIGTLILVADHEGNLRVTDWTDHESRMLLLLERHYGKDGFRLEPTSNPSNLSDALNRYFAGDLTAIDTLPVQTAGTPFQCEVWRALREIPAGTTQSYGQLATRIGHPPPSAQSASPTEPTPSASSSPATASSAPTAPSPATAAASNANAGSSTTNPQPARTACSPPCCYPQMHGCPIHRSLIAMGGMYKPRVPHPSKPHRDRWDVQSRVPTYRFSPATSSSLLR